MTSRAAKLVFWTMMAVGTGFLYAAGQPASSLFTDQSDKVYTNATLGISFKVPKGIGLYDAQNPGPLASQISAERPLYLVNPEFTEENINVITSEGVSENDLLGMKDMLDQNPNSPLPEYQRISVAMVKIGEKKDITAVEHVFKMKGNIRGTLRQITFVHKNRGFTFTCATAVERFDAANREFFQPLFDSLICQ